MVKKFLIMILISMVGVNFAAERRINRQQLRAREELIMWVDQVRAQQLRDGMWYCKIATSTALTATCLGIAVNMRSYDHGMCGNSTPFSQYNDAFTYTLDCGFKIATFVTLPFCYNGVCDLCDCQD